MDATFSKNLKRTSKASTSSKTQSPRRTGDGKDKSGKNYVTFGAH